MKYILLYNTNSIPKDIFDIIFYLGEIGYLELIPRKVFPQDKDDTILFLVDYENGMSEIISGTYKCIQFLSDQSVILHLKDKTQNFIKKTFKKGSTQVVVR